MSQADGYVAQHALGGGVRDVLQGTLEDQRLVVSGLVDLQTRGRSKHQAEEGEKKKKIHVTNM